MGLNDTPSGERTHIGFFGVRNAGKSSLVNAVTGQDISVVSDVKGTTTDAVKKAMELLPLGPVEIIDTPGMDDCGALGEKRVAAAEKVLRRCDIAVLVTVAGTPRSEAETDLISLFGQKKIPFVIAANKADLLAAVPENEDNTLYVSAREKAGIIKPGQVVVIMAQEEEVLDILLEQARSVDAIARVEGRDFEVVDRQMGVGGQMVTIRTPSAVYEDVFVPLFGQYQAHNAAAALVAVEAFMGGRGLDGRIVEQGLMNASSPGRMQVVRHSPTIIVDAAHNPAGAATLREAVESSFGFARIAGVYAAMGDKDVEGVLSEVEPFIDHLVVTQMPGGRAADIARLAEIAEEVFGPDRVDVRESLADAVDRAAEVAEAGAEPADRSGVLVFGSVMLAGEMLALAGHSPR